LRGIVWVLACVTLVLQPPSAAAANLTLAAQSPMESAALAARRANDAARPVLDELRAASAPILADKSLTEDARIAAVRALVDERREALTPLVEAMAELTRTQAIALGGMAPAEAAENRDIWRELYWDWIVETVILQRA
jgi:hypothetical protein